MEITSSLKARLTAHPEIMKVSCSVEIVGGHAMKRTVAQAASLLYRRLPVGMGSILQSAWKRFCKARSSLIPHAALCLMLILSASPGCAAETKSTTEFNGSTPLQWSERMADSQMKRLDDRLAWKPTGGGKWDYTAGLFTLSLLKLNEQIPNASQVQFVTNAIGTFISDDGNLKDYHPAEYQLDAINPGKTVIALYLLTKEERYAKAAALLEKQFATQPRTPDGGFWHKERYTNQMWLDGLYMGDPFYAEYTKVFNGPATNFDDVAHQFALVKEHLYDAKTGLYYHGWDAKKVQAWANPQTGTSSNFWGRAVGW